MSIEQRYILLGIGSNQERHAHITLALDAIENRFGKLDISRTFESEPVGFSGGHNFFNLVVGFKAAISVSELSTWTKQIERDTGRRPEDPKYGPRRLDIDILCIGELVGIIDGVQLPRAEILTSAFVLQPLAEHFPQQRHPVLNRSYADLWNSFDPGQQRLWPIDFTWHEQVISTHDADMHS